MKTAPRLVDGDERHPLQALKRVEIRIQTGQRLKQADQRDHRRGDQDWNEAFVMGLRLQLLVGITKKPKQHKAALNRLGSPKLSGRRRRPGGNGAVFVSEALPAALSLSNRSHMRGCPLETAQHARVNVHVCCESSNIRDEKACIILAGRVRTFFETRYQRKIFGTFLAAANRTPGQARK